MSKTRPPSCLKNFIGIIRLLASSKYRSIAETAYNDHNLSRQKYVISRVCHHLRADRDEPAPLLGLTALDIGCDDRSLGEGLTLRGAEVTAIDKDPEKLKKAEASAQEYGTNITFMQARPDDLIINPVEYDIILCMNVFKHVDNLDKLVWLIRQLLKTDGVVVFYICHDTVFSRFWHMFMVERILKWRTVGSYNPKRFSNIDTLEKTFAKHGMEIFHHRHNCFDLNIPKWRRCHRGGTRILGAAKFKDA